jgi:alkaline phosphatase
MRIFVSLFLTVILAIPAFSGSAERPKNIILMIADGSGFEHFKAVSYFLSGTEQGLVCHGFPVKLAVSTFSAKSMGYDPKTAKTNVNYVKLFPTDSAAAATAMATGVKTSDRSLGVDVEGRPMSNAVEVAVAHGRVAGLVTTVPLSHATPAAFAAHCAERNSYAEIAREMIGKSPLTVLMGGGHPDFDADGGSRPVRNYDYVGGPELWETLKRNEAMGALGAWTVVQDKDSFIALTTGAVPARVLGVAPVFRTLQQDRRPGRDWNNDGRTDAQDAALAPAFGDPMVKSVPTLSEMSIGALRVLNAGTKGFFLMIEGGAADWASHSNQGGRMIEELADFHAAIQSVCQWVEANGGWDQTLLIVTADHETGYLHVKGPGEKGRMPDLGWDQKDHTNQLVPLFARGCFSDRFARRVRGTDPAHGPYIDNTDIGRILLEALAEP